MSAADLERNFPQLKRVGYTITSPFDGEYNCIAYAAEDPHRRWWWPAESTDAYWPAGLPRQATLAVFEAAFRTLGYEPCESQVLESGYQKIALYADKAGVPTHAARQLSDGAWSSKLGKMEDIRHSSLAALEDITSGALLYGKAVRLMRRIIPPAMHA